jgi:hypothetical protein
MKATTFKINVETYVEDIRNIRLTLQKRDWNGQVVTESSMMLMSLDELKDLKKVIDEYLADK